MSNLPGTIQPTVQPILQFERVTFRLPATRLLPAGRTLLDDCSFGLATGELVVILGPSGCGKTTLLKLVNRLYEPSSGKIEFQGQNTRHLPLTELRRQMGYVIQAGGLFPHLTVAGNISVVPKLLGWSTAQIQQRVATLLELVELPPLEFGQRYPAQLSGGQQQRVGIARALAADPPLLLMDEPFGALDEITRRNLQSELLRLQRQLHKTILFVTHDVEEALRLADRILILERGQVVQCDTPLRVLTRPANAFVAKLLGAGDVLRQLSLVPVSALYAKAKATEPVQHSNSPIPSSPIPNSPIITADTNLRTALGALLETGATHLTVKQGEQTLGQVSLQTIQHYTCQLTTTGTVNTPSCAGET